MEIKSLCVKSSSKSTLRAPSAAALSGSKVEGWEIEGAEIKNVVVGKILSIEPHPDADKLVICQVDVGENEPIQIVTGATNVFPGAVVPAVSYTHLFASIVNIKASPFSFKFPFATTIAPFKDTSMPSP